MNKFLYSELEYLKENQDAGDVFSMLYKDTDDCVKKPMNKSPVKFEFRIVKLHL